MLLNKVSPVSGEPVLQREYQMWFADPTSVLWTHHHPVDLYVDKSLKTSFRSHRQPDPNVYDLQATKNTTSTL